MERVKGVDFLIPEGEMVVGDGDSRLKEELDKLRSSGVAQVVVDFSKVPYIDSSVLGQLVHGYTLLKSEGGGLKLLNPCRRITDLLTITRLITVFEIFKSREEALASYRPTAS